MNATILLVDDEPKILTALCRILEEESPEWNVHTAISVDDALLRIGETSFNIVVTDINMPDKDGFCLLHELATHDKYQRIPVIVVTGQNEEGLKRRALEMGAADLLNKPIHPQDLLARIRNAIRLKAYEDCLQDQNRILERKVAERTEELANSRLDIIWRLGKVAEYRDESAGNHVVRVGWYSLIIAERLGLERSFVERIFLASPLHDIGKIGIPDKVLLKKGELDAGEKLVMRKHCEIGYNILSDRSLTMSTYMKWCGHPDRNNDENVENPILELAASIARSHHEWWKGGGYPRGVSGNSIPLASRIVAIADAYDVLRSERPYKPALTDSEAREVIDRDAESRFDPKIYDAFIRTAGEFRVISEDLSDSAICSAAK